MFSSKLMFGMFGLTAANFALAADLQVEGALASVTQADPGVSVSVSVQVANVDAGAAGVSQLRYYLSANPTLDASDVYLNYDAVDALAGGARSPDTASFKVPTGTVHGFYYILFVADYKAEVAELDETNNVGVFALTVGTPLPDLVVSTFTTDRVVVAPNGQIATTTLVSNIGIMPAGVSNLKYYLSQDTLLDVYDKQLTYDKVDPLGVNASGAEDALVRVSSATDAGNYFLLFVADAANEVVERDETNNIRYQPIVVNADQPDAILADLVVENAAVGRNYALAGESLPVSGVVRNAGPATAVTSRLKYFISTNATFEGSDNYINYDNVDALASGATSPEDANLALPATLADGQYYVLFVADETKAVVEQYESNNVVAVPFHIGVEPVVEQPSTDLADLMAVDVGLAKNLIKPGEATVLTAGIFNGGTVAAPASRVRYYFSTNAVLDAGDTYLGYDNVDALAVGQTGLEDANLRVPSTAIHGAAYFLVIVDSAAAVTETDETNNVYAQAVDVVADDPTANKADLVPSQLRSVDPVVTAGQMVNLLVNVTNVGVQPAAGSRLKFYLSTDATWSTSDTYLDYRLTPALAVAESTLLEANVRIPHTVPDGARYIVAVADVNRQVDERMESNNATSNAISIGDGPVEVYAFPCNPDISTDIALLDADTIASYNTLHLGWANSKDMAGMACVISHFSLVGLVEVDDPEGLASLERAVETLTGEEWATHVSDRAVGSGEAFEYYGYIWREDRVEMTGAVGFYDDPQGIIKRDPYAANFRMGSFDFTLAMFHLRYGNVLADRRIESAHLDEMFAYFQAANGAEQDVLFAGDFNLPSNVASFNLAAQNLAGITDPDQGTSISEDGLSSSFDNIFFGKDQFLEYDVSGAYDFAGADYATLRQTVSDHIPVWVAVDTTVDDD